MRDEAVSGWHGEPDLGALLVPVESLRLLDKNPRRGDVSAVMASLERFGQFKPILVRADGEVIAGNHTLLAAMELGWEQIAVVKSEMGEDDALAAALADNRIHDLGTYDDEVLAERLAALRSYEGTGFTEGDRKLLDARLAALRGPGEDDETPPLPDVAESKRGEVYQLGPHRLMCGDSTSAEDVATLLAEATDPSTVTDPPYGIGYEYGEHDDDPARNAALVANVFALCGRPLIWTPGKRNLDRDISRFGHTTVIAWDKGFAQAGNGLGGASTWEPILAREPLERRLSNDLIRFGTDRVTLDGVALRDLHPCPKPVGLFEILIASLTPEGGNVYDPFGGSGTTLVAAHRQRRTGFLMEIDPAYCDVIRQRYAALADTS